MRIRKIFRANGKDCMHTMHSLIMLRCERERERDRQRERRGENALVVVDKVQNYAFEHSELLDVLCCDTKKEKSHANRKISLAKILLTCRRSFSVRASLAFNLPLFLCFLHSDSAFERQCVRFPVCVHFFSLVAFHFSLSNIFYTINPRFEWQYKTKRSHPKFNGTNCKLKLLSKNFLPSSTTKPTMPRFVSHKTHFVFKQSCTHKTISRNIQAQRPTTRKEMEE